MIKLYFLSFLFLCCCVNLYSNSIDDITSKPVRFYTPSEYKSDAQVWSISKGEYDDVYFATNEGIVLYDGVRWEKYVTPSECIMRSVFYDEENKKCNKINNIKNLKDHIKNNCSYDCRYFLIKKVK